MVRPLSADRLRRTESFRRLTGVSASTFDRMTEQLRAPWDAARRRKARSGRPWEVGGLEDHLLSLLVYYRCYVTQEFIGVFCGVDRGVICRAIQRIEALAKPAFAVRREPKVTRREAEALIVDCTEQPIQRPGRDAAQRAHVSGKKRRHTVKAELVVTQDGRIASVWPSHPGSRHDLTVRREGTKAAPARPPLRRQRLPGLRLRAPRPGGAHKKTKGGELAEDEKEYNRGLGSFRVRVEHRIGRAKRFRIASDRFRNPLHTHNTKFSIVAGLVNLEAGFPA